MILAEESQNFLSWIVFIPLIGALLNAFVFRKANVWLNCAIATLAVFIPFVLSVKLFYDLAYTGAAISVTFFDWISISFFQSYSFILPFQVTFDQLSGIFLLIITGIGSLIHLYSGEYMAHEKRPYRFFVYLNLFIVSMLFLVLGSNMLVTFLGWEGVGVCSYLLIGYWYESSENAMAGIKAFIANRIGDVGFLIAMFICYSTFGTLDYSELHTIIAHQPYEFFTDNNLVITAFGLCVLLAVTGKSAQIPLYTWLPDAMAGPTPVSALIHAATMVTSGIYLMNRVSFLLVQSEVVMLTIAVIGALTALLAATIGLVQHDIKKVLAYSTVSQL
ncbi:MAG: hypothetical protein K2X39_05235, partial [Silvanigrellaceae bacterium]|nr:hypothetical protein [Silvanigrellaceae bacterium]